MTDNFVPAKTDPTGSLVAVYKVQLFGHLGHSLFVSDKDTYQDVPDTQIASIPSGTFNSGSTRYFRVEANFAVQGGAKLWLRMADQGMTGWEFEFNTNGGPAGWWEWSTSPRFSYVVLPGFPWQRGMKLQMKTEDNHTAKIGGVWVVAEDFK